MRKSTAAIISAMALVASACGGSDDGGGAELVGDRGLDVCGLVSDKTVADLQDKTADGRSGSDPVEGIFRDAEAFIECTIISGVNLTFAVRAVDGGPAAAELVEGAYGTPPDPLQGVGDSAVVGSNTYDGVRIAATAGSQEVIVDSDFQVDGDTITRDDVIALAKEIVSNLGEERPAAITLPRACPQLDDAKIEETLNEVVVARGVVGENGSVGCQYADDARFLTLSGSTGNRGFNLMAMGDSDPEDRVTVDGDEGLFDDESLVVFSGEDCVLAASLSPFGDGPADQRPQKEIRDEAIDLVKYVKEEIGCPS